MHGSHVKRKLTGRLARADRGERKSSHSSLQKAQSRKATSTERAGCRRSQWRRQQVVRRHSHRTPESHAVITVHHRKRFPSFSSLSSSPLYDDSGSSYYDVGWLGTRAAKRARKPPPPSEKLHARGTRRRPRKTNEKAQNYRTKNGKRTVSSTNRAVPF